MAGCEQRWCGGRDGVGGVGAHGGFRPHGGQRQGPADQRHVPGVEVVGADGGGRGRHRVGVSRGNLGGVEHNFGPPRALVPLFVELLVADARVVVRVDLRLT